ncbi:CARDB domain-containing protein [Natronoglomus mannanivorans]|uniref:PGF-CTERM sorting domain-containing protein n=1 Tax=Natronoglomus mannanivorans TaxID=2979990 RepID=A0AAP2Z421_9EURY|nr:PGF-CTERM sorting domain-containing protein [Halobacteria archaeon AArc-xg1-1]
MTDTQMTTARAGLVVVLMLLVAIVASPSVMATTGDVSVAGPSAAEPGEEVTITFESTNTHESDRGYIFNSSIPENWEIVDRYDDGGTWAESETSWLWQTIEPDETVEPSVTVKVPENANGDVTIGGTLEDVDGVQDSDSITIDVDEPGETTFEINDLVTNDPITEGEHLEVTAEIESTGDVSGTQTVELDVEGLGADSTAVSLDAGETTNETFTVSTASSDAGSYTVTVVSEDDSDSEHVEVLSDEGDPYFEVELEQSDDEVMAGENVPVSAAVENTGEIEATKTLNLTIDGAVVDSKSVELAGGQTKSVDLIWETTTDDVGTSELTVSTEDDSDSTQITVLAPADEAFFAVEITDAPDEVRLEDDLEVTATVENLGGLEATQDVILTTNGQPLASESVTLAGDAETELTLTWNTSDAAPGEHEIGVETANDTETTPVTVRVPDEASFDVEIVDDETDGSVEPGGELTVTANVTNTGDLSGTQQIDFYVNDDHIDIEPELEVGPGSSAMITFAYTVPEDFEDGGLVIDVESPDGEATSTVTVEAPEEGGFMPPPPSDDTTLLLGSIDAPSSVDAGESFTVSVPVENHAGAAIDGDVWLEIDGSFVTGTDVALESDAVTTVEYDVEAPSAAGDYELTVNTDYGSTSTTLTVDADESDDGDGAEDDSVSETDDSEADDDETTADESDDETDDGADAADADEDEDEDEDDGVVYEYGDGSPGFGFLPALVALLGAGYLIRVRTP